MLSDVVSNASYHPCLIQEPTLSLNASRVKPIGWLRESPEVAPESAQKAYVVNIPATADSGVWGIVRMCTLPVSNRIYHDI